MSQEFFTPLRYALTVVRFTALITDKATIRLVILILLLLEAYLIMNYIVFGYFIE